MIDTDSRFRPRARIETVARAHLALDPVRETQATFRAALDALAWPGQIGRLPVAARGAPGNPWAVALLLTFLDHETSLAVEPGPAAAAVARFVGPRTQAAPAPAEAADFVLADAATLDPDLPRRLRLGSLAFPDDSATLVVTVPSLAPVGATGLRLDLAGPGVPPGHGLRLDGVPTAFVAARNEATRGYPRGVDLFLIDHAGRLAALPRSTRVRVEGEAR